ncbi:protein SCO1/2 [Jannaschia helgolandensis]|uniref:Protein SCO1/2 n=2 Tax=Jannaschia helgolandensis TaxID=188906 RepID=A0A1H7LM42_9RHOB|nr:protein SCO1/2 [Jannaschia helgolandensis]
MTVVNRRAALTGMLALAATPLRAHSVQELEQEFGSKEPYFQALDKDAPDFLLSDADGTLFRLADFAGKVVILHFVYTQCPDACPLHTEKLADVQARINQTQMKDRVQFVSITSDPENDTPVVLRDYGAIHGMDPANWAFLTIAPGQPPETTRDLAQDFGHKFAVAQDGTQTHGVVTHVIDKTGRWRGNFYGLEFDSVNMVLFVNALVNDYGKPHNASPRGLWVRAVDMFR